MIDACGCFDALKVFVRFEIGMFDCGAMNFTVITIYVFLFG